MEITITGQQIVDIIQTLLILMIFIFFTIANIIRKD